MPSLMEDFFNPHFAHALWVSVINGLKVLLVVGAVGGALTFLSGGTQPKHWPQKAEH